MSINVDPQALAAAAAQFNTQSQQLEDLIRQVTNSINQLEPAWKSSAAVSFTNMMTQWNTDVNNIQQVLLEVSNNVKGAGTGYETLDQDIAKNFNSR
ncbi:MAG: WXG100 family type VII secretion target [Ktedonobacteraceae bacterium]